MFCLFCAVVGPMGWIQRQMKLGVSARDILTHMIPHAQVVSLPTPALLSSFFVIQISNSVKKLSSK